MSNAMTDEKATVSLTGVFRHDGGNEMGNASWRCALVASLAFFVGASPALPSSESQQADVQGSVSQAEPLSIGNDLIGGAIASARCRRVLRAFRSTAVTGPSSPSAIDSSTTERSIDHSSFQRSTRL